MKKTFRNLLEGLSEKKERKPIAESDKNWSDSLRKIAKEKQLKSLSRKDRQTLEKIADMMAKANESADPKGTIKVTKQDKVRYITKDEWNTYRQMGWKQDAKHQDARRAGIGRSGETFRDRQARLGKPQTEAIVEGEETIEEKRLADILRDRTKSQQQAHQKAMMKSARDSIKKYQKGEEERDSKITSKDIKMAVGIANDPRYKGGDYSAAYSKIAKLKKGLVSHPRVKDALRQANESKRVNFKKYSNELKEASPRADAMAAIKRDKDFQRVKDVDVKATADDMKLAKKNPIVQLRKILDYKGGTMEFKDKKKLRVKADEADALLRGFDALQKVQDKEKYQHLIGSNAASFKKILKIVKR
jgi:hypothetical protein